MQISKNHTRLYWLFHLSGWLTMVGIEIINHTFYIIRHFEWEFAGLFCYGALLGIAITHSFRLLIKRSNVFEWRPTNIWVLAFLSTFIMSVLMNLLFNVPYLVQNKEYAKEIFSFVQLLGGTINWMRYVGVWVILYFMYNILERTRKIEESKLKSENAAQTVELELLKTQLNPHFLFNALNSIKALVSIDPLKSKDAIVKLSELLRFTLHFGNQSIIPLCEEIDQVKKYLGLEKVRFGNRLQVQFDIDEATSDKLIPPGIILTLAENAIKHGIDKKSGECILRVNAMVVSKTLVIEMVNSGNLELADHTGLGLRNIKKRLHYLFGERASFLILSKDGNVIARIEIAEA